MSDMAQVIVKALIYGALLVGYINLVLPIMPSLPPFEQFLAGIGIYVIGGMVTWLIIRSLRNSRKKQIG